MSTLLDSASLVVTPNAYKTSKLYSIVPSDGSGDFTATRTGDTATRVNSSGIIEINRTNAILQSNVFSNASWTKASSSITSGITDPLGGTSAFKLIDNTVNTVHYVFQAITTVASPYTFSVYAKAAEYTKVFLYHSTLSRTFDLSAGTVNNTANANIESIGNGWYRCSITPTLTAASNEFRIYLMDNSNQTTFTGTGTSGVLIWRSQLELGDVANPYINTTTAAVTSGNVLANVPRIDYTNGGCPQLLIEPSRTNVLTYSTMFDNSAWIKSASGTGTAPVVTKNFALSPSGTMSADKVDLASPTTGSTNYSWLYQTYFSLTIGQPQTFSIYVKAATSADVGKIISYGPTGGNALYTLTDQWQRITNTTNASSTSHSAGIRLRGGEGTSSSASILVWGAQLETNASYPTSYIQTFNASVTRNEDLIIDSTATSLIGQTDGTIFLNASLNGTNSAARNITLSDGTSTNRIILNFGNNGANLIQCELIAGGVAQVSGLQTTIDMTKEFKLAYAYSTNNFRMYLNGTLIATDTSGSTFSGTTLSRVAFTTFNGTSQSLDGRVKSFALWKTALSNADLASLTTL